MKEFYEKESNATYGWVKRMEKVANKELRKPYPYLLTVLKQKVEENR